MPLSSLLFSFEEIYGGALLFFLWTVQYDFLEMVSWWTGVEMACLFWGPLYFEMGLFGAPYFELSVTNVIVFFSVVSI